MLPKATAFNSMTTLSRGQKIKLADLCSALQLQVALRFDAPHLKFDFSCFGLDENGKLSDDRYFIFYNQKQSPEKALQLQIVSPFEARFALDLSRLPAKVKRLVFVATIDGEGAMNAIKSGNFFLGASSGSRAQFTLKSSDFGAEKAVMVAEIYFKSEWRVAANGQGFKDGLGAVLKHFGGQETDSPPLLPPALPAPQQVVPPRTSPTTSISPVPPRPSPVILPANACSDCGKTLNLLERGRNSLAGDNRCSACDHAFKQQQQLRAQQQANAHLALRGQVLQRILSGELPIVPADQAGIVLKRGEVCHYITPAQQFEERVTSTARVHHGATARIKICRGVTYRVGATQGKAIAKTGMVQIDAGRLVLTNQRYIFDGQKKNLSVLFSKLVSFEPFADGIELNAENKKTQQYKVHDGEMAAIILSTILNL